MTAALTKTAHAFETPYQAALALVDFEFNTERHFQYEITAVFGSPDRALEGYQVRVKDLDGFGVGYVSEEGQP